MLAEPVQDISAAAKPAVATSAVVAKRIFFICFSSTKIVIPSDYLNRPFILPNGSEFQPISSIWILNFINDAAMSQLFLVN